MISQETWTTSVTQHVSILAKRVPQTPFVENLFGENVFLWNYEVLRLNLVSLKVLKM